MRGHHLHRERSVNEGAENYAKAIYHLQGRSDEPVHTNAVAERLGVTAASASAMLRRLSDEGLVDYEPYHGARLTPKGEAVALETIRHHRLIELFLAEVLGMPWDRVHEEAEVLEHHISEELEELIAAKLGQPALDPHGDPIPDRDLAISSDDSVPLTELDPGERGMFARVSDSDASMLRYLAERNIQPGDRFLVKDREPFGGAVVVEIAGRTHPLGPQLAESMRVSRGGDE
ncbi:MAG TPA: metal-dependent transcriptional regulator [Solirubrobacterales bacterium]|jgi:DtxR family transcriptional regulator, Mn-dependent transcriptional regulator|nr:metal-dependent transcriptional regulator [Solirubrobacterales bacterium]